MPIRSSLGLIARTPWLIGRRIATAGDLARHPGIYRAKLVTVDVFDTALLRTLAHPDDVYALSCWRAKQRHGLAQDVAALVKARRDAEAREVRECATKGVEQASIERIFDRHDIDDPSVRQALLAEELDTERDVCRRNDAVHEIVRQLFDRGVRVAFLSDTVFSSAFIKERLVAAGYPQELPVYVSSEFGVAKATGRLFGALAARLGLDPRDIWHIGDNVRSDVLRAREAGVHPLWYRPKLRAPALPPPIGGTDHEIQASVAGGVKATLRADAAIDSDALSAIGSETTGPVFLAFAQWVIEGVKASGPSQAYFLARDAFGAKLCYDALARTEALPPSVYLYVSRRSLVYPQIKTLDDEALGLLCNASQALPTREFFERIGLDAAQLARLPLPAGLDLDSVIDPRNTGDKDRLKAVFKSLEPLLLDRFAEERRLLKAYLDGCGFGAQARAAICDVGYSATSQRALARYLTDQGAATHLAGFYMYTAAWVDDRQMGGSTLGWLEDRGRQAFGANFMALSWALMDFFCGAPHGTTLGYRQDADGVRPVLRPMADDDEIADAQSRVQAGTQQFLDGYVRAFGGLAPIAIDRAAAVGGLERLVRHPTLREAEALGGLTWIEGLGSTSTGSKVAEPPPLAAMIAKPASLLDAYRRTLWRPGFVVRLLRSRRLARMIQR